MSSDEDFIKSYKLAGLVLGKKNAVSANQIPVVSADQDNQIEDSGITKADIQALITAAGSPQPAIGNVASNTVDAIYDVNEQAVLSDLRTKVNAILQVLRNKNIILP